MTRDRVMTGHECTTIPCERCRIDAQNRREWNLEAAEDWHRYRCEEDRADWIADTYERDER